MANIREQASWVHRSLPQNATQKANQLVAMAVAKARLLHPISRRSFEVDSRALVIGGGLAGMSAALSIARQGFGVYLVERAAELGGNLRHIFTSLPGSQDPQAVLQAMLAEVANEPLIQLCLENEVVQISGFKGQYRSLVRTKTGEEIELAHGAIIVATGGREISIDQYLLGKDPRILTQRHLEARLQQPEFMAGLAGKTIVMIQCVGSRDAQHPYCSRVCCTEALKNALAIKQKSPDTRVVILYRDLRSYGFREHWYHAARQAGVIFLEYTPESPPEVQVAPGGGLQVQGFSQPENAPFRFQPAWLVLSVGIEPNQDNTVLAQLLKVPLNETHFFLEAHVKLRPVDFAAEGIFLCGLAHSPRDMQETIAQAQAAAVRAAALLARPQLDAIPLTATVDPKLCAACGQCVEACPYGARRLEAGMRVAEVIEVLCQGCGACVVACPNKASQLKGFEIRQELALIDAACS
jgi:heterodisulfide reductase subunit A